jgi:hypothetical protein
VVIATRDLARGADDHQPGLSDLYALAPALWLSVAVEDRWESARVAIALDGERIVAADGKPLSLRLRSPEGDSERGGGDGADLEVRGVGAAGKSSDPAAHTVYGNTCTWRLTCGGTAAQIRWPRSGATCFDGAVPNLPLAVILRGTGFSYRDYDYLQTHLARNGILSASLDLLATDCTTENGNLTKCAASHQLVADQSLSFLTSSCLRDNFLERFPTAHPVDFQRTAVIGHSRGGESARYLDSTLTADSRFTTRAVLALAPTRHTDRTLFGDQAYAYLLLYGTSDPDVPPRQAFRSHDLTGWNEFSTPTSFDLDRGMKLLVKVQHRSFLDGDQFGDAKAQAQGYANAFLRAWLLGDWTFYGGYVRGDAVPGAFSSPVYSQFSSATARRVIDNFEDGTLTPNTLGGSTQTSSMSEAAVNDGSALAGTEHVGRLLTLRPGASGARVTWNVPASARNASSYLYLSLRIGRLTGSGAAGARLGIRNGSTTTWVDLANHGGIPAPESMCVAGDGLGFGCDQWSDRGHMRTIRVPLPAFGAVNDVQAVHLEFLASSVGDRFVVDNVELSDTFLVAF